VQQFRIVGLVSISIIFQWFFWPYTSPTAILSNATSDPATRAFSNVAVEIDSDAVLTWTTVNERDPRPFYVEQYAYDKWMRVGMIYGDGGNNSKHDQ
jgi:hypothetical protein